MKFLRTLLLSLSLLMVSLLPALADVTYIQRHTNLGIFSAQQGRWERADGHLEKAMAMAKKVFGEISEPYHRAIEVRYKVAFKRGDEEQAIRWMRECLMVKHTLFSDRPGAWAVGQADMAAVLANNGNFKQALSYSQDAVEVLSEVIGASQQETLRPRIIQTRILTGLKRYDEAQKQLEQLEEEILATFGQRHYLTAMLLTSQARLALKRKQLPQALEALAQAHAIRSKLRGSHHPHTLLNAIPFIKLSLKLNPQDHKALQLIRDAQAYFKQNPQADATLQARYNKLAKKLLYRSHK
uniref:MalT-like TPR region domain-containing protein n=1 Tax=Magnetococcus massalia (strain MO-1) TaxID=451514 RepID=A0A1S7LIF9_MAGMO|nr:exported protein of unknown function [Candidatus Magnetococcus massalia]